MVTVPFICHQQGIRVLTCACPGRHLLLPEIFDYGYCSGCEVMSPCGLNLLLSLD